MTDLISPTAETRVIPHQAETTAVTRFEGTVRLNPPALRRPWAGTGHADTVEQPAWPTGAEVTVGLRPPLPGDPPPLPPPPNPPPVIPGAVEPPTQRLTLDQHDEQPPPKWWHPRHRRCRCVPMRAVVAVSAGTSALTFAALFAIAWQVAQ